jgi:hypothetical protein
LGEFLFDVALEMGSFQTQVVLGILLNKCNRDISPTIRLERQLGEAASRRAQIHVP